MVIQCVDRCGVVSTICSVSDANIHLLRGWNVSRRHRCAHLVYYTLECDSDSVRGKHLVLQSYLHVECNFLHDVHTFRKCFGHLLHAVEILHRLLYVPVLFQQLELS